ncbi:hypothetical protein BGX34_005033 [Mortierella sp. NVP85]|nr:hypothetical protein BGX34_005033 [Mortierella sp. NVP85]
MAGPSTMDLDSLKNFAKLARAPVLHDFDIIGTVPGFEKFLEADTVKHSKGKLRFADVASLSGSEDHKERKPAKRKKVEKDSGSNVITIVDTLPGETKEQTGLEAVELSNSGNPGDQPILPPIPSSTAPTTTVSPVTASATSNRLKHINGFRNASSAGGKGSRSVAGPWPQMPLTCVRIWPTTEFTAAGMSVQFGTDRLSLTIKRNSTRVQHSEIKLVNYYTASTFKIFQFSTFGKLADTSILARHCDPTEGNVKSPMITLFIDTNQSTITNVCAALKKKGIEIRRLTHEAAEKILASKNKRLGSLGFTEQPINAKSKSIAVRAEDVPRLDDGEYLNDTLIEFGLKYALANAEAKNPSLVGQIHIFNTFFYQRLVAKPAKGVSNSYDAIKSWTAKVDIFSKKYIIVPINENMHWYLVIITNPGLLIGKVDGATHHPGDHLVSDTTKATSEDKTINEVEAGHGLKGGYIDADEKPYILCLDSLGGPRSSVFGVLRSYLQQELLSKKGIGMNLTSKEITGKFSSKCPKQDNLWDCGIYLLHFVEVFLRNPVAVMDAVVNKTDDKTIWSLSELALKRAKYKEIVNALTAQYRVYQFHRDLVNNIKGQSTEGIIQHKSSDKAGIIIAENAAMFGDADEQTMKKAGNMDVIGCLDVTEAMSDGTLRKMETES